MTADLEFPLCDLDAEVDAEIVRFAASGPDRVRFEELGMIPGARIRVLRRAPLGDPIQVRVGRSLFSIRKEEAVGIFVKPSKAD